MREELHLVTDGLLSKWGFHDGDLPEALWDWLDEQGVDFRDIDWHAVLRVLVRRYVLPALDQDVETVDIETSHNPIRAEKVNGRAVDWYEDNPFALTPDVVSIPYDEVLAVIREADQT